MAALNCWIKKKAAAIGHLMILTKLSNDMQRNKVILFNGAPRSGKDTAANFICSQFLARPTLNILPLHHKMAEVLKDAAHAIFGLGDIPHDFFEACKDEQRDEFFGKTPREVYISLSEKWMKPNFGNHAFGAIFCKKMKTVASAAIKGSLRDVMIVCSDVGFESEVMEVVKSFGAANVLLFRLHRDGCDFKGDSRNFVNTDEVCSVDIQNENKTKTMIEIFGHILHWYDFGKPMVRCYA